MSLKERMKAFEGGGAAAVPAAEPQKVSASSPYSPCLNPCAALERVNTYSPACAQRGEQAKPVGKLQVTASSAKLLASVSWRDASSAEV